VNEPKLVLISLLIKLGVAAAVSAVTARALTFQRLLFAERRTTGQTLGLLAFLCIPLTLGVWIRFIVPNFYAADISFETVIILGILLGPFSALLGGAVLSLPAMLHHEYLTLPFLLAVAVVSGLYGQERSSRKRSGRFPLSSTSASIAGCGGTCASRASIARSCC
jgi:two-component system LytT family sensor kinase